MELVFIATGESIDIKIKINWRSMRSLVRGILTVIAALISLLATPEIARLGANLGWW